MIFKLTNNYDILIDEEDFEKVSKYNWMVKFKNNGNYVVCTEKYWQEYLHRFIMDASSNQEIDHRNGNGLDNRKNNLRFCTRQENIRNSAKRNGCISSFKGVIYRSDRDKWRARIIVDGIEIFLGDFLIEEDADKAYDKAAKENFGEFARTNF